MFGKVCVLVFIKEIKEKYMRNGGGGCRNETRKWEMKIGEKKCLLLMNAWKRYCIINHVFVQFLCYELKITKNLTARLE